MYEELDICRAIMRLYTLCDLNSDGKLIYDTKLSEYLSTKPKFKKQFECIGIIMLESAVKSTYNNIIKITPQISYVYREKFYTIPKEILENMINILEPQKTEIKRITNVRLYWGYLGRVLNKKDKTYFITEGLQVSPNIILLDLLSFLTESRYALHYRLIHEILHVLGYEEKEINQLPMLLYMNTYDLTKSFIDFILTEIKNTYDEFRKAIETFKNNNSALVEYILKMGNELNKYDFPTPMDTPVYATVYALSNLFPPDINEYKIFAM